MINQAPIVRYTASVSEKFFPNSWRKTFSAESFITPDLFSDPLRKQTIGLQPISDEEEF
jgi:hypothetical protein